MFLDADKKSLRPAILWCDTRALKEAEEIVDAFGCATIQNHNFAIKKKAMIIEIPKPVDVYEKN